MVNYTEKGVGLVELLLVSGVQIVNGGVRSSLISDEETQHIIDNYDPVEYHRNLAVERITRQAQDYIKANEPVYPESESRIFETQKQEANAYSLDSSAFTPTIDLIAFNRGVDRTVILSNVMSHVIADNELLATVAGKRQKALDDVWAETDYTKIDKINFEA